MIKTWENMAAAHQYTIVHDALIEGLNNLAKWYKKTDDSAAYFICLGTLYSNIVSTSQTNKFTYYFLL
jgi:hypothetical protein